MTIEFRTVLIRKPLATQSGNWQETANKWTVFINNNPFDYYTGRGLVDSLGKPKAPSLDDVLHALVFDAYASEMSFDDWCCEYGYDTDSRRALDLYLACQEQTQKLRKAGVSIAAERERLADY